MSNLHLTSIILAAGKGSRMHSKKPKVLHSLGGIPLLQHVLATAELVSQNIAVVVGHQADQVIQQFADYPVKCPLQWVKQSRQQGTGDAVKVAMNHLKEEQQFIDSMTLVLYGDVPLVERSTLDAMIQLSANHQVVLLSTELEKPEGYGRIVRDATGSVISIVEQKDADLEQRQIKEINSGILIAPTQQLVKWLDNITNTNAQGEYYLTDIVACCVNEGGSVGAYKINDYLEISGVNNQIQRTQLERYYQQRQINKLTSDGLGIADHNRIDIRGKLDYGQDVFIDINVIIEGHVTLGNGVTIGANCVLKDCHINDHCNIKPFSIIEDSTLGKDCIIGPFARIRPETQLSDHVHIGNFVETKKTTIEQNSKVNHLSYIGDSVIGKDVNVGAGTITCNYDGATKHQTIIDEGAFIGSGTQLVAPIHIGKQATTGAGSAITNNVPDNTLSITRAKQQNHPNWQRPTKKKTKKSDST